MSLHLLSKRGKLGKTPTDSEKVYTNQCNVIKLEKGKGYSLSSQINDSPRVKTGYQCLDDLIENIFLVGLAFLGSCLGGW